MATARAPRSGRTARAPRTARAGRAMSHRARRQLAPSPDAIVERVVAVVGGAFEKWADRFVSAVVRDLLPNRFRADATLQGLFEEAGRATPDRPALESAFRGLDKQSADELRVAGVRTADVVPRAPALQQEWLRSNTDLIKAEADLRRRVERILSDPLNEGRSVADISKMLQEQAGYSKSRAELTARDQTLKLYGKIQETRQQSAGITQYIWTTSLDERVREDHAALDGTTQSWDDPPVVDQRTGRRGHPGFDFQCRCTATPILPDFDDDGEPVGGASARAPAPPREPAMSPSLEELRAAEAARVREFELLRAEAEANAAADRRIAEARRARELARLRAEEAARAAANRPLPQIVAELPRVNVAAERPPAAHVLRDAQRQADTLHAALPEPERAALKGFTGAGYRISRLLQMGVSPTEVARIVQVPPDRVEKYRIQLDDLAKAQQGMRVLKPTARGALYRGMGLSDTDLQTWMLKDTVEFAAASNSTTYSPKVARDFADAAALEPGMNRVLLKIVDVDEAAANLQRASLFKREREMIVGKGRFRVVGRAYDEKRKVHMIEIAQDRTIRDGTDRVDARDLVDYNRLMSNGAEFKLT